MRLIDAKRASNSSLLIGFVLFCWGGAGVLIITPPSELVLFGGIVEESRLKISASVMMA